MCGSVGNFKTSDGNGVVVLWRFDLSDLPCTHSTLGASSMAARVPSTPRRLAAEGLRSGRFCAVSGIMLWADPAPHSKRPRNAGFETLGVPVKICKSCRREQPCREGVDDVRRDDKSRQSRPAGRDIRALGPRDMFVSFFFHARVFH
jgi:hypothetical protein